MKKSTSSVYLYNLRIFSVGAQLGSDSAQPDSQHHVFLLALPGQSGVVPVLRLRCLRRQRGSGSRRHLAGQINPVPGFLEFSTNNDENFTGASRALRAQEC
jgi:hypothetical protein